MNHSTANIERMNNNVRSSLRKIYKPEIDRVQKYFNINLEGWHTNLERNLINKE